MKASNQALDLIKEFEGFRSQPYKCPAGLLTVGYGDTDDAHKGPVTRERAHEMLLEEVAKFEAMLAEVVTYPLNQNQWDALVSFSYNVKWDQFLRSKLLAELNRGNFPAALSHWRAWHHATVWDKARQAYVKKPLAGLIRRRNAEVELFKRPIDSGLQTDDRSTFASAVGWLKKQLGG